MEKQKTLMANEIILTEEEKEFIKKRRVREARKNKKMEELVAEAFKKLPTLGAFLRMLGISMLVEDERKNTSNLHGLFVEADGLIAFKEEYYGNLFRTGDVPVWTISYKNIRKICGQKIPFDCRLEIEVVNHKVIAFKVSPARNIIFYAGGMDALVRGRAYHQFSYRLASNGYEVPLYNLDKNILKNKLITSIHRICSQVYKYFENEIACVNERLQKVIKDRDEAKAMLGSYYKTFERKEE